MLENQDYQAEITKEIKENLKITAKDRRVVSNYLNTCLGIHFEGVKNLKSLKILREILSI